MNFHVLTLFPQMIEQTVNTSITGRAVKNEKISLQTVNIRDFADNKHMRVDDYPYGGGAGMVMKPEPVYRAYESVKSHSLAAAQGKRPRCIYLTPQGKVFNQTMAEEFALEEELIFLCGHYEGIDERVLEEIVTDYVSIGDYVLTGGELAACVMIDAISRFVPGVLNNEESSQFESKMCIRDRYKIGIVCQFFHGFISAVSSYNLITCCFKIALYDCNNSRFIINNQYFLTHT